MTQQPKTDKTLAISYFGLRRTIGFIGFLLPLVLSLGKMVIAGAGIEGSISAYYYTSMGAVFVGSLCAIGVFLLWYTYKGHDHVAAIVAGIFAIGVALFPTTPAPQTSAAVLNAFAPVPVSAQNTVGTMHVIFAALFFLTLAYMSIFLFTRTYARKDQNQHRAREFLASAFVTRTDEVDGLKSAKKKRNLIYRICGYTIVACIALMGLNALEKWDLLFWLETVAVMAFGFSWLVKGEAEQIRLRFMRSSKQTAKGDVTAHQGEKTSRVRPWFSRRGRCG